MIPSLVQEIPKSRWAFPLVIALVGFCLYSFMLGAPFKTMDDPMTIVDNALIKDLTHLPQIFQNSYFGENSYYRPLVAVSHMIEYHFFRLNPFYFNLTNVLLHIANALLLFLILSSVTRDKTTAFGVAFLFVIHPVHWEAVANIPGRAILLCAFWYFASLAMFRRFSILSWIAFALALLSKESAVTLPFVIVLYEFLLPAKNENTIRENFLKISNLKRIAGPAAPYFILLALYFILRKILGMTNVHYWNYFSDLIAGVMTFFTGTLTYLKLIVLPTGLYYDRAMPYFISLDNIQILLTLVVLTALLWTIVRYHKNWNTKIKFFLAYSAIVFLPVSQLVPIRAFGNWAAVSEHFLYLPFIGIAYVLVEAVKFWSRRAKESKIISAQTLSLAASAYVIFLMLTTAQMAIISTSELAMLRQSLEKNPHNTRVRTSYGLALANAEFFQAAEEEFRKVLIAQPWDVRARISLGKALCDQSQCWAGIREYEKIPHAGKLEEVRKRNINASYGVLIRRYQTRLAQEPDNAKLHYSLGVMFSKTGKIEESVKEYRTAIALDPQNAEAVFNLASSLDALGQRKEAMMYYIEVIRLGDDAQRREDKENYARQRLIELDALRSKERLNKIKK